MKDIKEDYLYSTHIGMKNRQQEGREREKRGQTPQDTVVLPAMVDPEGVVVLFASGQPSNDGLLEGVQAEVDQG